MHGTGSVGCDMNHPIVTNRTTPPPNAGPTQWQDGVQRHPAREGLLWSGVGALLLAFFAELIAASISDSPPCTGACASGVFFLPVILAAVGGGLLLVRALLNRS